MKVANSGCPDNKLTQVRPTDVMGEETISFYGGSARLQCIMLVNINGISRVVNGVAELIFPYEIINPQEVAAAFDTLLSSPQDFKERQLPFMTNTFENGAPFRGVSFLKLINEHSETVEGKNAIVDDIYYEIIRVTDQHMQYLMLN